MMVAGQAGRTLRTLTASSLSVPDLQSAQPGTVISDSQHQDIHWGLNVHVYVHSKGVEGLKRVLMKRIL